MKNYLLAVITVLFLSASIFAANPGYELIKTDYLEGKISHNTYLLQKFYYGFDQTMLDARYSDKDDTKLKCGSELMQEYYKSKSKLSSSTINEIDALLNKQSDAPQFTYISPYGKFQFTYQLSGPDAVPPADNNGNSIPDYVEWCASYMDHSWKFEIDTLGNLVPPIGSGFYQVSFEAMEYYGYCQPVGGSMTEIVLHNTFLGFPPNTDPEGNQKGAAKVTCAHEFKHALQILYNDWNDPGWFIEMDATWMEDQAYDLVNDYYNYLSSSQILNPGRSFERGQGYEDCLWMLYLTQRNGIGLNKQIWLRRKNFPTESIYTTFNNVLIPNSSDFILALKEYFIWNAFTGTRKNALINNYKEAAAYPTTVLCRQKSIPDTSGGCGMDALAASVLSFTGINNPGILQIKYKASTPAAQWLQAVMLYNNNTHEIISFNADSMRSLNIVMPRPLSTISSVTLIPVVTENYPGMQNFNYSIKPFVSAAYSFNVLKDVETPQQRTVKVKVYRDGNYAIMDSLKLYYKTAGTGLTYVNMTSTGVSDEYSAVIPSYPVGTRVYYYFSVYDLTGRYVYHPSNAPVEMLSYYIGTDNMPPHVTHNELQYKTKHDFPFNLFITANDNIGLDSLYVEYNYENFNTYTKKNFIPYKDSVYYVRLEPDTSGQLRAFTYRIVAVDKSLQHNRYTYPATGFKQVNIGDSHAYYTSSNKIIKDNTVFGIRDTVDVPFDHRIKYIKIYFEAEHNRSGDLFIRLIPPFANVTPLMKNPGLGTALENLKNPNIVFDQSAYLNFTNFAPIDSVNFTGEYKADTTNFSFYEDKVAKGKWVIIVSDTKAGETGILKKWGVIIASKPVSSIEEEIVLPETYTLFQNYPNPFNPSTKIRYYLPVRSEVMLKVYDVLGKEVATLVNDVKESGMHETELNTSAFGLSSGVYLYKLTAGNYSEAKKLILLK